jgi:hypothetical protein
MRPTLPRAYAHKFPIFGGLLCVLVACQHVVKDPPATPGPPLPAEPDAVVDTMERECERLIAALATYGECPNLVEGDRQWVRSVIEYAQQSCAAGVKAEPDDAARRAMAMGYHRAAASINFATQRCLAGPRPQPDY